MLYSPYPNPDDGGITNGGQAMNAIEKFALNHATLKDIFNNYIDNSTKTSAYLIVAIGWILTSSTARDFLASQGKQRSLTFFLSLAVVLGIAIIHSVVSVGFYQRSQKKAYLLSKQDVVEAESYDNYQISLPHLFVSLPANLFLFAILFTMIFVLKDL
jgi:hypothetical protein